MLTVEDDGRGISIADRCRLFQPFFTTKAHGTGLGLFVSRQILEDHAGTLSFRVRARPGIDVSCSAAGGARAIGASGRDSSGQSATSSEPLRTQESNR